MRIVDSERLLDWLERVLGTWNLKSSSSSRLADHASGLRGHRRAARRPLPALQRPALRPLPAVRASADVAGARRAGRARRSASGFASSRRVRSSRRRWGSRHRPRDGPGARGPGDVRRAQGRRVFAAARLRAGPGMSVVVVEDVFTTGKSTREAAAAVEAAGGRVVAVGSIVDRGLPPDAFTVPSRSLLSLSVPAWPEAECPLCRAGVADRFPGQPVSEELTRLTRTGPGRVRATSRRRRLSRRSRACRRGWSARWPRGSRGSGRPSPSASSNPSACRNASLGPRMSDSVTASSPVPPCVKRSPQRSVRVDSSRSKPVSHPCGTCGASIQRIRCRPRRERLPVRERPRRPVREILDRNDRRDPTADRHGARAPPRARGSRRRTRRTRNGRTRCTGACRPA